jgi:RNA 2',3'-cyclic 3'-phosphodiesterase
LSLFFALWPPAETARALSEWAEAVQRDTGGRATSEDKIHLTLAFLGDADPAKASAAGRRVRGKTFELPVDTAKYWRHNKIVWAGPETMPPPLEALVRQLHAALKKDAFALEARPFAAHVTLVRKANPPRALAALPRLAWPVSELLLMSSTRSRGGSSYAVVERFAFA